jgi:hypothetical protein
MNWRLTRHPHGGWLIECKEGLLSFWKPVIEQRRFSWQPDTPHVFKTKGEAAAQMAKLIQKYS